MRHLLLPGLTYLYRVSSPATGEWDRVAVVVEKVVQHYLALAGASGYNTTLCSLPVTTRLGVGSAQRSPTKDFCILTSAQSSHLPVFSLPCQVPFTFLLLLLTYFHRRTSTVPFSNHVMIGLSCTLWILSLSFHITLVFPPKLSLPSYMRGGDPGGGTQGG